jgi:hypothetical protein
VAGSPATRFTKKGILMSNMKGPKARLFDRANWLAFALLVLVWTLNWEAAAEERPRWKLSTGLDYSSGDYGDVSDTEIWYVPFTFSYERFPWTAKLTVPWLQIEGPGGVIGGGDSVIVVGPVTSIGRTRESGLGDVVGSLQYSVDAIPAEVMYLDLTAKVKFPTADEDKGLGTGEFDYTLQADVAKVMGRFTPLATLGYKIKGDPAGAQLDNVWFASIGGDYRFAERSNFGATLDFQQAATERSDDSLELFTYVSHRLNQSWSITAYGYFGFSDGSPDEGLGLQVAFRY